MSQKLADDDDEVDHHNDDHDDNDHDKEENDCYDNDGNETCKRSPSTS